MIRPLPERLTSPAVETGPAVPPGTANRGAAAPGGHWLRSPLVSFVPHLVAAGTALTALAVAARRPRLAVGLGTGTALVGAFVARRITPARQPSVIAPQVLRVMTANLFQGRFDADALVELVRRERPDLLVLQELRVGSDRRLDDAGIAALLGHRSLQSGRRNNDNGVFSRFPLAARSEQPAQEFHAVDVTLPGGGRLAVIGVHPMPPTKRAFQRRWAELLGRLPAPSDAFARGLILGDFNATVDHAQLRALLRDGWRDAAGETGQGLRSTWRGLRAMAFVRLTIDHILVPPGVAITDYGVHDLPGSDHRAVTATLAFPAAPAPAASR